MLHPSLTLLIALPLLSHPSLRSDGELILTQGPFVGHVEPHSAKVWARASAPGEYSLVVTDARGREIRATSSTSAETDGCMVLEASGLEPNTAYHYRIEAADGASLGPDTARILRTAPALDEDADVRIMFASCAREDEATAQAWQRAATEAPDAVVLLGDTPYIDRTDLTYQRKRYAEFASFPVMADLLAHTPWYGTWDDHDFGSNDTDGRLAGQPQSRRAFIEYHANPSYGDGEHGIYTSFRRGPVEVFILDTRTFAAMEPSPFLGHHASLLGAAQWAWLMEGLKASTAPVKVLSCGMIWNGATRPGKLDHWGSYPHEREALFRFIGKEKVEGVTLIGGDIHRSRVLRHASADLAGYDIIELIVSPMHDGIIGAANAPHPGLIKDMGEPRTILLFEASQRTGQLDSLRARFINAAGDELFAIDLAEAK